jgi:hypothetical protein
MLQLRQDAMIRDKEPSKGGDDRRQKPSHARAASSTHGYLVMVFRKTFNA